MTDARYTLLPDRAIIRVAGEEAREFLQGLITNDIADASDMRAIYAALLTPQGKYLHDFFVLQVSDFYYLDCQQHRREDLLKRLKRYRLRAKVEIEDLVESFDCFALFGRDALPMSGISPDAGSVGPLGKGFAFVDPRRTDLGLRAILPPDLDVATLEERGFNAATKESYDILRLSMGIAEGAPEIEPEKSFPMDYGLDELNGVSFNKGCYVGQEVTVRMKTRDLVRKCLVPVRIDGPAPAIGASLRLEGTTAGELRGLAGPVGIALVRKEALDRAYADNLAFETEEARLIPGAELPSNDP